MRTEVGPNWLEDKHSITKCKTAAQCLRKFFYRYVCKIKEAPSVALLTGRAVHNGQEVDNYAKLRAERLGVTEVLDAAVAALEAEKGETDVSVDAFVAEHSRQLQVFEASGERAKVNPVPGSVEAAFALQIKVGDPDHGLKPATVEGFVDVVSQDPETGERTVIDYKSAMKPASLRDVEEHLQLALEATGAEAQSAKIVSFVKQGKQKPTTKVSPKVVNTQERFEGVLRFLADTIHAVRRAIKTGDFPKCDPAAHYCKRGFCEYFDRCYPKKETDLHKWIQVEKISPVGTLPVPEWRESAAGKKERERSAK